MATLHDMLKASGSAGSPDRAESTPRQHQQINPHGCYSKIAMPAVAAAARYQHGLNDRAGEAADQTARSWQRRRS